MPGGKGANIRPQTRSSQAEPPPSAFTYQGVAIPEKGRIVNDVKAVNGFYLMGMHCNGQEVFYSASRDPTAFPPSATLFKHHSDADKFIVSLGFVVDHTATRPVQSKSAPRSLRRALLMPQVNTGSLYRRGMSS